MTTPTAAEFAAARFAQHPDGRIAARVVWTSGHPWTSSDRCRYSDSEMVAQGWRIVTPALDPSDPDVIDQAAQRARDAYLEGNGYPWENVYEDRKGLWRDAARAALTPPPARDPEAEKLESLIDEWKGLGGQRPTLPDFLASRGVRVGGGEG